MDNLETVVALFRTFAQDDSEKADIEAANILRIYFAADASALFYLSGRGEHRFCLAGASFPIGLSSERWIECISKVHSTAEVAIFGPWAIPGFGSTIENWMGAELYSGSGGVGYLVLGRSSAGWSPEDQRFLASIAQTIAPIVAARIERERADFTRRKVETNLAENERRLRAFFENSRDMIYTADSSDIVTSINAAGLAITGRQKEEVVGQPFSSLVFNPSDRKFLLRRLEEDGYVLDFEILLKKKQGGEVFCLETTSILKGADGKIIEIQGGVKDLSERIKSERELWKTNLELAETNQKLQKTQSLMVQQEKLASIGQLAAGVAHEINNPLGFITSNQKMLMKYLGVIKTEWQKRVEETDPSYQGEKRVEAIFSDIDAICSESNEGLGRIVRIVANLKSFSRVDQAGALELFDVNGGIESTLNVVWNEIKYVAEIEKDLSEVPRIMARGGEINQVILNLLVNAAQAIEAQKRTDKGHIKISTKTKGDCVVIAISDDGPGIRNQKGTPWGSPKSPLVEVYSAS